MWAADANSALTNDYFIGGQQMLLSALTNVNHNNGQQPMQRSQLIIS
jgi:hypothetical protein